MSCKDKELCFPLYSPFQKDSGIITKHLESNFMTAKKTYQCCVDTVRPVQDALDVINGKWKLLIIISISLGNERFTDIQKSIPGITPKVLSKELRNLEQNKLIKRIVIEDYPVKIIYRSEPYADTLTPVIYALKEWGINHRKKLFASAPKTVLEN